ncbi:cytidine deaminase [Myxococcota bacterium]|nr:cytidine deaminase [Myxococcota bacterium]MBU1430604.1 cytidine deaminase [Myxococcota bacterium]MBU1898709.1 cytidine deaminase [Myxococcota bacterium]
MTDVLLEAAKAARLGAYAPYSRFRVGAAVEDEEGRIFTGCNIENATYGLTVCAERVALLKAVSEGAKGFKRMVIVTQTDPPAAPCGLCRQTMSEFAGPEMALTLINLEGGRRDFTLEALFPEPFLPQDLEKHRDDAE